MSSSWLLVCVLMVCQFPGFQPELASFSEKLVAQHAEGSSPEELEELLETPYFELYGKGKDAYLDEEWERCVWYMEKAVMVHKHVAAHKFRCRQRCFNQTVEPSFEGHSTLQMMRKFMKRAACTDRCEQASLGGMRWEGVNEIQQEMDSRVPYDYMQLCYYKLGDLQKAAASAYTFLQMNLNHDIMRANIAFYRQMEEVQQEWFRDREKNHWKRRFMDGMDHYLMNQFEDARDSLEAALELWYQEYGKCRSSCERPNNMDIKRNDLWMSLTDRYVELLLCRRNCIVRMSHIEGRFVEQLLANMFHYLQYVYFQLKDWPNAMRNAATYLIFYPTDPMMTQNVDYFLSLSWASEDMLEVRPEAAAVYEVVELERKLLQDIQKNFGDEYVIEGLHGNAWYQDEPNASPPRPNEEEEEEEKDEEYEKEILEDGEEEAQPRVTKDVRYGYNMPGVTVVKGPRDLKGPKRMVADGIASEEECKMLSHLAKGGTEGNGYEGDKHVHTEFERFDGLTVLQAAELAKRGLVSVDHAEMYLNLSNKARRYVHGYFHMKHQLFFTYTHLVCRTAEPYSTDDRTDLSHPIHADNCHLLPDGSCPKKLPAFTWRDWSAILYLNEGFKGGEFIFTHANESVQSSVKPKCGRLVGFSAGEENLHGVKAVVKGRRCALAMWYTLDERYNEVEHYQARKILQTLKKHRTKASKDKPKEEL
ncbi:PREDICTED: prolyl 3-hydroxylase 2-like isoform X2 [Branchiostoma belcheri]|uniref:procollagen-proline 3-dioxygenase n=1 Tax=Branchiostoma belcheri TaxID=7741 RepID=A0A6P5A0Y5_BRABE|nr:PREDICTED: prolyl 3-hydroxylase 2-like isoform X2 [Branchiostoma belcheri]